MHFAASHSLIVIILVWTQFFKQSQDFLALFSFSQCLQGFLCKFPPGAKRADSRERCLDHPAGGPSGVGRSDPGGLRSLWWELELCLWLSGGAWGMFCELSHAFGSFSVPACCLEGYQSSTARGVMQGWEQRACRKMPWNSFLLEMQSLACVRAKSLKPCPTLCNLWTTARRAPLSTGFSRQEYWSELPPLSPAELRAIVSSVGKQG